LVFTSAHSAGRHLGELERRGHASGHGRRVHEDVDPAERVGQRRHHRAYRFVVAGVTRPAHDPSPGLRRQLGGRRVDALLVASGDADVGSLHRELSGNCLADAAAAARHDRPFATQIQVHVREQ
jgi:hypothetical protein